MFGIFKKKKKKNNIEKKSNRVIVTNKVYVDKTNNTNNNNTNNKVLSKLDIKSKYYCGECGKDLYNSPQSKLVKTGVYFVCCSSCNYVNTIRDNKVERTKDTLKNMKVSYVAFKDNEVEFNRFKVSKDDEIQEVNKILAAQSISELTKSKVNEIIPKKSNVVYLADYRK